MYDLTWRTEAEKRINDSLPGLEAQIKEALKELSDNPAFRKLERARACYESRSKMAYVGYDNNPRYYNNVRRILKRKVESFARSHKPEVIFSSSLSFTIGFKEHREFQRVDVIDYLTLNGKSSQVYGIKENNSCSCPQNRTEITLFRIKDGYSMGDVTSKIDDCKKKQKPFYLEDLAKEGKVEQLDSMQWDHNSRFDNDDNEHYKLLLPNG